MNGPNHSTGFWINEDVSEELLRRQIAYYKARLMDMEKAPPHSRHREGWATTAKRLQDCREKLAKLRGERQRAH